MPAKFQLNTALTHGQRVMLDKIYAGGRGPNDQAVIRMLLAALEDYWKRFEVYPSPMRIYCDVPVAQLRAVAEHKQRLEDASGEPGFLIFPNPGETLAVAETAGKYGEGKPGPTVDELAEGEAKRRAKHKPSARGAAAKGAPILKTDRH